MYSQPIEDILRYHKIDFDAPKSIRKYVFDLFIFCVSQDQTAEKTLYHELKNVLFFKRKILGAA